MQRKKCKFSSADKFGYKNVVSEAYFNGENKPEINSLSEGKRKMIDKIALSLLIVGGLNWGSIGLFKFDIVAWIFGGQAAIGSRIVYALVGLAALWCVSLLFRPTEDAVAESNR